jgi:hypothetical protein
VTDSKALVERVVAAIGRLVSLGETIEDEWTYVHDLEAVWVARLRAVAAAPVAPVDPTSGAAGPDRRPSAVAAAELEAAIDRLVAEADMITDPHRAIDWLSTLPQATLVALGEAAW